MEVPVDGTALKGTVGVSDNHGAKALGRPWLSGWLSKDGYYVVPEHSISL